MTGDRSTLIDARLTLWEDIRYVGAVIIAGHFSWDGLITSPQELLSWREPGSVGVRQRWLNATIIFERQTAGIVALEVDLAAQREYFESLSSGAA